MIHDDADKKVTAHDCCFLDIVLCAYVMNSGRNTSYGHELHTSWICNYGATSQVHR